VSSVKIPGPAPAAAGSSVQAIGETAVQTAVTESKSAVSPDIPGAVLKAAVSSDETAETVSAAAAESSVQAVIRAAPAADPSGQAAGIVSTAVLPDAVGTSSKCTEPDVSEERKSAE
jgi:hypothetical protein